MSKQNPHTPGWWRVGFIAESADPDRHPVWIAVEDVQGNAIATVSAYQNNLHMGVTRKERLTREEVKSRACLIAAAPEMLAMLSKLVDYQTPDDAEIIRALIARAQGKEQANG